MLNYWLPSYKLDPWLVIPSNHINHRFQPRKGHVFGFWNYQFNPRSEWTISYPTIMIRYIPRNKFVIYLIPYTGYTFPILGGALHQRILISLNIPPCQIAEVH